MATPCWPLLYVSPSSAYATILRSAEVMQHCVAAVASLFHALPERDSAGEAYDVGQAGLCTCNRNQLFARARWRVRAVSIRSGPLGHTRIFIAHWA